VQNAPPKPTHYAAKIPNPTQSDFKYLMDFEKVSDSVRFGFRRIRIPSHPQFYAQLLSLISYKQDGSKIM